MWGWLLVGLCACRINFEEISDANGDARRDGNDVLPGSTITFGERPASNVKNVTSDAYIDFSSPTFNFGATEDLSVAEQNHSAALAIAPVEQGDVNRIQPVFHNVPKPPSVAQRWPVPIFMPKHGKGRNASDSLPCGRCSVVYRTANQVGPRYALSHLH